MKTQNTSVDEFIEYIENKEIYIYGVGDFYQRLTGKVIYPYIHKSVVGYIDNGRTGEKITVLTQEYEIHGVGFLKDIQKGIVLLCGTNFLDEMYQQLVSLQLPDEVECFIMPLIWAVSDGKDDSGVMVQLRQIDTMAKSAKRNTGNKIDKRIHCCWFSGEKKPEKYRKCIDTWKRMCPDYEMVEWNAETYDCGKNTFIKQAFEKKKWAFVSDYARLDVIYHYGGIYLDMDVELLKDFEPLLQYDAFFNYGVRHMVELGSGFGSTKHNPFIGSLLKLYEDVAFLDRNGQSQETKYVQPVWINDRFLTEGFWMNGDMQLIHNMLLLPRRFYTPKDDFFLWNCLQCEETRGIHHFNSEWQSDEYQKQRIEAAAWAGSVGNSRIKAVLEKRI